MKKDSRIFPRIIFFLYIAAILYLCFGHFDSLPKVPKQFWGIDTDKWIHFLMFLPFPILSFWAFKWPLKKWWNVVLFSLGIFIAGCLIAAGTEYGQGLTGYRNADIKDFQADFLAISISSFIVLVAGLSKTLKNARQNH